MGLGDVIKLKVERTILGRVLAQIDAWGSVKWPGGGWLRFKGVLSGWKLLLGSAVSVMPQVLDWFASTFPGLMHNAGLDGYTASVVHGVGIVFMVIGSAHKIVKFVWPDDPKAPPAYIYPDINSLSNLGSQAQTNRVQPISVPQVVVTRRDDNLGAYALTKEENALFLTEYNKNVNNEGMQPGEARLAALQMLADRRTRGI